MEIMEDPVMDHCAHNFERAAVTDWLNGGHSYCPISRKPLSLTDLVPNHALAERLERWKFQKEQMGSIELSVNHHSGGERCCSETVDSESDAMVDVNIAGDVETGKWKRRGFAKSKRKRIVHYESIPVDLMLLPQERLALQVARSKEMEQDQRLWRTRCFGIAIIGVVATLSIALVVIGVAQILNEQ
jgi:U-box domain